MPLNPGSKLAHYEILAPLGKGGMGEVFRGRDTKLGREVAVKVLPAELAGDPERLIRFDREARALAALNHPNIAQIYGVEHCDGAPAMMMELVPGDTLAHLAQAGPMPLDKVLRYAAQMASALEAAHDKGIIHRDFKPANVMVTPDGQVKVLDFGLAAPRPAPSTEGGHDPENSPTLTLAATQAGTIMGTAAYMSPEQASGGAVDKRADIWSFGVVVWELLSGQRMFEGQTLSHILAAVLTKDPDLSRVPERVRPMLAQCLEKDPKKRLRDIGDALLLVREPTSAPVPAAARQTLWPWVAAALMTLATAIALWAPWRTEPALAEMRLSLPLPVSNATASISPDGRRVVFSRSGKLWVRELNSQEVRELGSASGRSSRIMWSPDSRSIAFQSSGFELNKISLDGAPPVTLCAQPTYSGGAWNQEGVILVAGRNTGLNRVSQTGGAVTAVTTLAKGQTEHLSPQFLPDGRFLYQVTGTKEVSGIYLASFADPQGKRLLPVPDADFVLFSFSYVAPQAGGNDGYLLYRQQDALLAQPVDPSNFTLKGSVIALADGVGDFSVSSNGTLVFASRALAAGKISSELRWVDRGGKAITGLPVLTVKGLDETVISRNGRRGALALRDDRSADIWLFDMSGGAPSRFTFEPTDERFFTWSPDEQWLAYATGVAQAHDRIQRKNTLTSGPAETLVSGGVDFHVSDWSSNGKYLLLDDVGKSTEWDIFTLDMQTKGAKPAVYLQTPASERNGKFSPDGRWVVYESNETRLNEVFVQSFPPGAGKFQISTAGGSHPRWRADGRELYYTAPDGRLMAVKIQTTPRFEAGPPQSLFRTESSYYGISPDGNRFLMPVRLEPPGAAFATVVLNWQAGLKK